MTSILGRIDEVLAASRVQELDLIIETLFGEPIETGLLAEPSLDFVRDDSQQDEDSEDESEAYRMQRKMECGFSSWHASPINYILNVVNSGRTPLQMESFIYRNILSLRSVSPECKRQVRGFADHCISMIAHGMEPLRWDVWLYLDMHGEEGLQP